jgi:uncharacterized RDD family membrane protein YckC
MKAADAAAPADDLPAPSLRRRLACFIYEGVLLFGVLMISGYLFSSLTQQRDPMVGRHALQGFVFIVLGIYFVYFWSHGGQTVAMKAWHIRVVDRAGQPVSEWRALARYVLAWLWFMPALAMLWAWGVREPGIIFSVLAVGVVGYAALAWLHPAQQFLHDVLCATRLVTHRPAR